MKTILLRVIGCAALAVGSVSCVEVPGGYYGGPYRGNYYGYRHDHDDHHERHHEVHCYCGHKSCGCKPGHPKGGCYCDGGRHRH
jgi:hypothetical protein